MLQEEYIAKKVKELKHNAILSAKIAVVCGIIGSTSFLLFYSDSKWVGAFILIIGLLPVGAAGAFFIFVYEVIENMFLIKRLRRGIDPELESQKLLIASFRTILQSIISLVIAISLFVFIYDGKFEEIAIGILVAFAPAWFSLDMAKMFIEEIRKVGRLEEKENNEP